MSIPVNDVELTTGVRLQYVEQGDPAGVPVIMLHGYSDSWRSFEPLLPHLPAAIHAYAVTQRGHGDWSRPAAGYRPEDHAGDVVAFMDATGLERAVIVGHSGGSYTAQRIAVDHPDRVLGVVLIGAFRSLADNPDVVELSHAIAELTDPVDPEFIREFQESTFARPVDPSFVEAVVGESRKLPARVWKAYLAGLLEAPVPIESGTITAPTLIVWGDRDEYCPRSDQEALAAAIEGARLVTYTGTGHVPQWEQPDRLGADVAAFARSLVAVSA